MKPFVLQGVLYALTALVFVPALVGLELPLVLSYAAHKALHLLGVVLFLGHNTVSLMWAVAADRSRDPKLLRFGLKWFTWGDTWFTAGGLFLIVANGAVLTVAWGGVYGQGWLVWSLVLLGLSALPLVVLLPAQVRLWRALDDDDALLRLSSRGRLLQSLATVVVLACYWGIFALMTLKP